MTLHQRFCRIQLNLFKKGPGCYRLVSRKVADRFCAAQDGETFSAKVVSHPERAQSLLILDFAHIEIGVGSQLLAFVGP